MLDVPEAGFGSIRNSKAGATGCIIRDGAIIAMRRKLL
jgi:hypothetical protein